MKLTEAQEKAVHTWVDRGLKVYEIQNLLESEFGISMTYLDVHMLLDDIQAAFKSAAVPPPEPAPVLPGADADGAGGWDDDPEELEAYAGEAAAASPAAPGRVQVEVDQITQPGSIVSGKVTFGDGKRAGWLVDQMGRLGFMPEEQGYRPSPEDMRDFQVALQRALSRYGF
jgi:hypothetical protein